MVINMWVYKTIKICALGFKGGYFNIDEFNHQLNKLGAENWELVTSFDTNEQNGKSRDIIAILKKHVEDV